jgi:TPR repeat protein
MKRLAATLLFALCCAGAQAQAPSPTAAELELVELAKKAAGGAADAKAELERRAQGGETLAEHFLGVLYTSGKGVPASDTQAVDWFTRAAKKGHVESMHNLAVVLSRTPGSLKDPQAARSWYRAAAEKGYARSQAGYAEMLAAGAGGPVDRDEARVWIQKSAAQNEPRGLYLLGMLHIEGGAGVDYNVAEGARLLGLAAQAGERDAQYEFSLLNGTGTGVPKSDAKALEWLQKSAAKGQPKAQYYLAAVHRGGLYGAPRNDKLALDWLRKSALQEYGDAEYALGLAYAEGRGVRRDPVEAFGWMRRAARHGNAEAIRFVRNIESRVLSRPPAQEAPAK